MARPEKRRSTTATRRRPKAAPPGAPGGAYGGLVEYGPSVACCLLLLHQALQMREAFRGAAVDDAYISFRYVDNLVAGHGLVWNLGERVEGFSNFLWVVLLAPFAAFVDDLTAPAQGLGLVFGCATVALSLAALRRLLAVRSVVAAALAGGLLASSGYVSAWAVSGLESSLHALLLVWAWAAFPLSGEERARRGALPAVPVVALALLRPEGLFVAAAAVAWHLGAALRDRAGRDRRSLLALPLAIAGPLAAYHGLRLAYYGAHLWPNAVRAKVGVSAPQVLRGLEYVADDFLNPYAPLLLAALAIVFVRGAVRRRAALGLVILAGSLAFVAVVGGDWSYGRFFAPLVPLAAILCVAGLAAALEAACARLSATAHRALAALVAVAVAGFAVYAWDVTARQREHHFRVQFADKDAERIAIGRWLARAAPPDTIVAVYAAGQIPYYSRLPSHDMLGLNDAHIASVARPALGTGFTGHERFDVSYTLETIRPDVIVDPQYIPGMLEHSRLRAAYRREPAFVRSLVLVRRGLELAPPGAP